MLQTVATRKFAHRLINYIFTVWDYEYILNRLPELNVTTDEVHGIIHDVRDRFPGMSRAGQFDQCKKELIRFVTERGVIIDP